MQQEELSESLLHTQGKKVKEKLLNSRREYESINAGKNADTSIKRCWMLLVE